MNFEKFLTKTVENGIASKVYRILLVIWDVICINGCSSPGVVHAL